MTIERLGGTSGLIAVAAVAAQYALAGSDAPDRSALLADRAGWEAVTLLRLIAAIAIVWFTAGLAARLRRFGAGRAAAATTVLAAGVLWGAVWLLSGLFNSAAISMAAIYSSPAGARFASVLGAQSVLVLTPVLSIAFLMATAAAVLAVPTFPRRYGYTTLAAALLRIVLATVDWWGVGDVAMRIMDFTLMWIVVTSIHLLGATRPAAETAAVEAQ